MAALVTSSDEPLRNSLSELGTLLSGEHGFAQDFVDAVIPHVPFSIVFTSAAASTS